MEALIDKLWPHSAFVISLTMGLLIGLERERAPSAKAGLRTFSLVSLSGTLAAMLSSLSGSAWPLAAGLVVLGGMIVAAYFRSPEDGDPGTTTVAAVVVCYGLGALVWYDQMQLAVMLAILTTVLLYFKRELEAVSHTLTRRDLLAILQFCVLSLVILPVLPDQGYGPYAAINPRQVWWMVVLISGLSLAGYAALRIAGQRHGSLLTGLLGGIASSTATTLSFARHSASNPDFTEQSAFVILTANGVVLLRLMLLIAFLAPPLMSLLIPMLVSAALVSLLVLALFWRSMRVSEKTARAAGNAPPEIRVRNPGELRAALAFGGLYAGTLFLGAWLADWVGRQGLFALAAVSGLTDVDAITLTGLRLFSLGEIPAPTVATLITLALTANILFKTALTLFIGGRPLALRILPGMAAVLFGLWAGRLVV